MRTKLFLTAILFLLSFTFVNAQTPFTTLSKELVEGYKITNKERNSISFAESTDVKKKTNEVLEDTKEEIPKVPLSFFNNNALAMNLINTGNRVSLSAEVLHYKLFIASPNDTRPNEKFRYNIPLMVISKLSTEYDEENSASAWDVLDYEAAPVTLRIMPSFSIPFKHYNDIIYYGFYLDLRGLNMHNQTTDKNEMEFVGSGGLGFTFEGDGEAGQYNESGGYKPGKYSLSFILQGATGQKEVIQRLFDTENDYVTSIQTYFLFNVDKDSKFNLKIGYQYLFQDTLAGSKSNFSIALGI